MVIAVVDTVIALGWSEDVGRMTKGSRLPFCSG